MASNISNTSQAVQALVAANPAPGLSTVDQAKNIANPGTVSNTSNTVLSGPFGPIDLNARNWGPAHIQNLNASHGQFPGYEPPMVYFNMPLSTPPFVYAIPLPNPNFSTAANTRALQSFLGLKSDEQNQSPNTGGETPITQSISAEVDKIIEESQEVVAEIETKIDPVAEEVITEQDVVQVPAAITPTELLLDNQASCEKQASAQAINIEIINEINVDVASQPISASFNFETAEAQELFKVKMGCMDPDALNYDPEATINDASLCKYEAPDPVKGCIDPTALNYDADATEDDGSCTYTPKLPPIPLMSKFLDSHGQVIFEVPRELVESQGKIKMPKGNTIKLNATRELVNPDSPNPIVRPFYRDVESDLILTIEDPTVFAKKESRRVLGELASDIPLGTDEDIVIRNQPNSTDIIRNTSGVILITQDSPILKTSLRSQAFIKEDFRKAIDTTFNELVGKL